MSAKFAFADEPRNHACMPRPIPPPLCATPGVYRFKPWNIGRVVVWSVFALLLIVAPLCSTSSLGADHAQPDGAMPSSSACPTTSCWGRAACSVLGMRSIRGLGSFIAIHAMNLAGDGGVPIPLWLIPLVGGLAGHVLCRAAGVGDHQKVRHHRLP